MHPATPILRNTGSDRGLRPGSKARTRRHDCRKARRQAVVRGGIADIVERSCGPRGVRSSRAHPWRAGGQRRGAIPGQRPGRIKTSPDRDSCDEAERPHSDPGPFQYRTGTARLGPAGGGRRSGASPISLPLNRPPTGDQADDGFQEAAGSSLRACSRQPGQRVPRSALAAELAAGQGGPLVGSRRTIAGRVDSPLWVGGWLHRSWQHPYARRSGEGPAGTLRVPEASGDQSGGHAGARAGSEAAGRAELRQRWGARRRLRAKHCQAPKRLAAAGGADCILRIPRDTR